MNSPEILQSRVFDESGRELKGLELHVDHRESARQLTLIKQSGASAKPKRVDLLLDQQATQMIEQGWQSWSTVRRSSPSDIRRARAAAPRWYRAEMMAQPSDAGRRVIADGFINTDAGLLGVVEPSGPLASFSVDEQASITLSFDLESHPLELGESLRLGTLYGDDLHDQVAKAAARNDGPSLLGWCSWYQYFAEVTPAHIRANMSLANQHGLDLVQIDDGWQREIGIWDQQSDQFDVPIESLAKEIGELGMRAGIWTAPFLATAGGELARRHPEWLLREAHGMPRVALQHFGWGGEAGRVFALDTTREDVLDHLRETYAKLRAKGFSYFKIDFLFAAAIDGLRQGGDRVLRQEALRMGLAAIREGIGEDAFLLGCGSPLVAAVGLVDAMRVSEDVAPYWQPRLYPPGFPESSVGCRNAVEQSALRAEMHRRWWINDPDCLLLRPSDTQLNEHERAVLTDAILGIGAYCVLSDDLSLYGSPEWAEVERIRELIPQLDKPLSIPDPFATPLSVEGPHHRLDIDWESPKARLALH